MTISKYCPTCGNPLAVRGNGERAYCCNCGQIFQRVTVASEGEGTTENESECKSTRIAQSYYDSKREVKYPKIWRCVATTSGNNAIRGYLNMEDEHEDRSHKQQDSCDK